MDVDVLVGVLLVLVDSLAALNWATWGWREQSDVRPVPAADREGLHWSERGQRHLLSGEHAFYRELQAQITSGARVKRREGPPFPLPPKRKSPKHHRA